MDALVEMAQLDKAAIANGTRADEYKVSKENNLYQEKILEAMGKSEQSVGPRSMRICVSKAGRNPIKRAEGEVEAEAEAERIQRADDNNRSCMGSLGRVVCSGTSQDTCSSPRDVLRDVLERRRLWQAADLSKWGNGSRAPKGSEPLRLSSNNSARLPFPFPPLEPVDQGNGNFPATVTPKRGEQQHSRRGWAP
jgi:hypothetical protein